MHKAIKIKIGILSCFFVLILSIMITRNLMPLYNSFYILFFPLLCTIQMIKTFPLLIGGMGFLIFLYYFKKGYRKKTSLSIFLKSCIAFIIFCSIIYGTIKFYNKTYARSCQNHSECSGIHNRNRYIYVASPIELFNYGSSRRLNYYACIKTQCQILSVDLADSLDDCDEFGFSYDRKECYKKFNSLDQYIPRKEDFPSYE